MCVQSLAVKHTSPYKNVGVQSNRTAPCQTLSFSTISMEPHLFQSVNRLNPVFQPILTVTIVTVNMGWNTGFISVTDLNKGCSLLTLLKLNVRQGVCSSVRLDTNIFIGTSVLNCQILKTLFSPNMSLYGQILLPKQCLQVPACLLRPKPYLKAPSARYYFDQKLRLLKILKF